MKFLFKHPVHGTRIAVLEKDINGGKFDDKGWAWSNCMELYADAIVLRLLRGVNSQGEQLAGKRRKFHNLLELKTESNGAQDLIEKWAQLYAREGWRLWTVTELKEK